MNFNARIFVAGHNGLVGRAIVKGLYSAGFTHIIVRSRAELNLLNGFDVENFFLNEKPEYVFLAAAKVGGIVANNTYRADFLIENLSIQNNVISSAHKVGVKKLLFLGSTCIYPKNAHQPLQESSLLSGALEYTNEPYAIAKIAGIKLCESYNIQYGTNFISVMPTNLFGPGDNFNFEKSHVLPALLRKIYLAKCLQEGQIGAVLRDLNESNETKALEYLNSIGVANGFVNIWGSGKPLREFMWSEDMANACIHIMRNVNFSDLIQSDEIRNTHINIGTGEEISIEDLAKLIADVIGYKGDFHFDSSKPDGTMRKLTDVSKLHSLGFKHEISLREGIERIYSWYLENSANTKH
ncbi:MAG: GDP-L-fucose synthase family protein [Sediminibacterium sp.]